ncbi:hypothetical protein ACG2LH_16490 [Zhouia sp. PK063]|uniref:hypothetical protein n=1 Tax=Zhouia sp. PK063 TaxID=3373602 RepID=UPI003790CE2C
MKKLWTLIAISILNVSCSNKVELEQKNKELTDQNLLLLDSINRLSFRPDFSGFPDSLRIDTTQGLLGKIYNDTLVILAEYADCGEWGGHREWLKIHKDKDLTKVTFTYDSVACRYKNEGKKYFQTEKTTYTIDKNLQQEVIYYLFDINRMTLLNQKVGSNAANSYEVYIKSSSDLPLLFNLQISFIDWSFNWDHFQKLKNKIKTNANRSYK